MILEDFLSPHKLPRIGACTRTLGSAKTGQTTHASRTKGLPRMGSQLRTQLRDRERRSLDLSSKEHPRKLEAS